MKISSEGAKRELWKTNGSTRYYGKNRRFPPDIVNAVRWHHDTNSCYKPSKSVDVVHVANVLCLMIGIGIGKEGLHHDLEASAVDRLKLKAFQIELVAGETEQWIDELLTWQLNRRTQKSSFSFKVL